MKLYSMELNPAWFAGKPRNPTGGERVPGNGPMYKLAEIEVTHVSKTRYLIDQVTTQIKSYQQRGAPGAKTSRYIRIKDVQKHNRSAQACLQHFVERQEELVIEAHICIAQRKLDIAAATALIETAQ